MKKKFLAGLVIGLLVFGMAGMAMAIPIAFTFGGKGTGTLDSTTTFTNANFVVDILGDTENVLDPSVNLDLVDDLTGSISIDGVGTGAFKSPLFVFGGAGENYLGFGTNPGSGNLISFFDPSNDLTAFDLKSNFGPIVETNDNLSQFDGEPTTIGVIGFTSMTTVTFTSTLAPVPEPATMLLLGSGLIALAVFGRKFKKR